MIVAGPLAPIEEVLEAVLVWLHETVALPWAWAIVALTVIVRMLLVPLMVRQVHSMQNLQKHAPEMKALQQRWKHDKVRQREELMKFYAENKINPASSCLPILAQIPIFLALFFVLRDFDEEVIQPRFPDSDLGWLGLVPSITESANSHWSGYMLLAIYAISQTTSTLLMSTTMDRMQRTLLLIFPLAFLFFILNFPSGLVLYWVTTNLWTTGQGLVTRQLMPKAVPPPKRSSRTPPKERAEAEAEAEAEAAKPAAKSSQPQVRRVKRKKKARR